MRSICISVLLFFSLPACCQSRWHDQFHIKTGFQVGETQTYEVKEFFKVDNILLGIRSTVESLVRFEVLDTANGGYLMSYRVLNNAVKKQHDSSTFIMAALTDGLVQYFFVKDGTLQLDSASFALNKMRVSALLDTLARSRPFGKNTAQFILRLQTGLQNGEGMGELLAPLLLFDMYYTAGVYKKFRIESRVNFGRLFGKGSFTGLIGNKWESTSKDSSVVLSRRFTGDPVPTARYFKPIYESLLSAKGIRKGKNFYPPEMRFISDYEFHTQPSRSFPVYLFKKNVSEYLFRDVSRIEMKKW